MTSRCGPTKHGHLLDSGVGGWRSVDDSEGRTEVGARSGDPARTGRDLTTGELPAPRGSSVHQEGDEKWHDWQRSDRCSSLSARAVTANRAGARRRPAGIGH